MHETAKKCVETMRKEVQEAERLAASLPGSANPLTPGIEANSSLRRPQPNAKAKAKAKPKNVAHNEHQDKKKIACPRLVRGLECKFGADCWWSHTKSVVDKAKASTKKPANEKVEPLDTSKLPCRFHKRGSCKKGDSCDYSHEDSPAEPSGVAVGLPVVACPLTVGARSCLYEKPPVFLKILLWMSRPYAPNQTVRKKWTTSQ